MGELESARELCVEVFLAEKGEETRQRRPGVEPKATYSDYLSVISKMAMQA